MTHVGGTVHEYDVVVIGAGSGNTILTPDFDDLRVAIVERDAFGGTCLNRGCIPTKMFAYTADTAQAARHAGRLGVDVDVHGARWSDVVERIFGRIDPIALGGEKYRRGLDNVTVHTGEGRFVGENLLAVRSEDGEIEHLSAPTFVLATGSSPAIPPIPGLDKVTYFTSDTIMRVDAPPQRLLVLGGGFVAVEMAHVFDALGSNVTIIEALDRLLIREDDDVSELFTRASADRYECVLSARATSVKHDDNEIVMTVEVDGSEREIRGDALLVATGRMPNSALDLHLTGVEIDSRGFVLTDEFMRTSHPGIWALGDVTNPMLLKHTANAEARIVAHNVAHPEDLRAVDVWPVPHAVFGAPQVASVGATEQQLRQSGVDYVTATQRYGDVAYGWAMEDTEHFCKVIADPATRRLLGAHIIGPNSSMMLQQLVLGMKFDLTVDDMARGILYVHPALTEVVENALLQV